MNSLVKRSDVLRILCDTCLNAQECAEEMEGKCEAVERIIDLNPVQEMNRGEWLDDGFLNRKTCSVCGTWIADNTGTAELNYCPNCGADMRSEKNG